ncbi:MAG: hypothetical protein II621_10960 [Clostridia bacterium]|jgi:hypothetical protein|nr:hypothetical protein [Clostridia bacterium]MBQ4365389.1 hypothetical protein [Clostridia bacterium]MBQ6092232.1 hypothetical protein [Clostridia bacterium]
MKTPFLTLKLACAVCAAAFVLFALLAFVLPQAKVLLCVLCAVFFLALSLNVHALQKAKRSVRARTLDRAA